MTGSPYSRPSGGLTRSEERQAARRKRRHRRQGVALAVLPITGLLTFIGTSPTTEEIAAQAPTTDQRSAVHASRQARTEPTEDDEKSASDVKYPMKGPGTFILAPGESPLAGTEGEKLSYRVQVENGITNLDPRGFADTVSATLGDKRSWTAGGEWRFKRVSGDSSYDFTIYLVTPATRDRLCKDGVDGYTSCRMGDNVVINVARWAKGIPNYGASLDDYRRYAINHEVGHRLGHGHQKCPSKGAKAPVMQQQTLVLDGCVANSWPYPDGSKYYHGKDGEYEQKIPPAN